MSETRKMTVEELAVLFPQCSCNICATHHKIYREHMSLGLANALRRFALSVNERGVNCVHIGREAGWSYVQYSNRAKLRFHGMIAIVDEEYVKRHRPDVKKNFKGYGCLTHKGAAFLRGEAVMRTAIVLHGKSYGYDEADGLITIHELNVEPLNTPYWETAETLQRQIIFN